MQMSLPNRQRQQNMKDDDDSDDDCNDDGCESDDCGDDDDNIPFGDAIVALHCDA